MMTQKQEYTLMAAVTLVVVTLVSTCSPLYPSNPYCDANIYLTVGRNWWHGLLPYRDLYDQKGPLLHMAHALAALISDQHFFGVYLLELIGGMALLMGYRKVIGLWTEKRYSLPAAIALMALTYTSTFFCFGDTVEELMLPILVWSWYPLLRYAKCGDIPSVRCVVGIALAVSVVFWTKFTIVLPYAGMILAALIIAYRREQLQVFLTRMLLALMVFVVFSLAVILFFFAMGAGREMLDGYLLFNLFHYNTTTEGAGYIHMPRWLLLVWAVVVYLFSRIPDQRDVRLMVAMTAATTTVLFFAVFCYYYYYLISYFLFAPVVGAIMAKKPRNLRRVWIVVGVICVLTMMRDYNLILLLRGKADSYAVPMAEYIATDKEEEDPQLLVADFLNSSIFNKANLTPRAKYFFTPNSVYPAIRAERDSLLCDPATRYVVTPNELPDSLGYELVMTTIDYDRGVGIEMFTHKECATPVHLYKRIEK